MKHLLNLDSWPRKNHFNFFKKFDEPFWGVTVNVDCTIAHKVSKSIGSSFFIYYLHKSISAINSIEEFKYRIDDKLRVEVYDKIHASATINRADGTFGFSCIRFDKDYKRFEKIAINEIKRVRANTDLVPASSDRNVIHYSSIPWLSFTSLSHARQLKINDSTPKITFGKLFNQNGKMMMPVSIHVHHALMDGYHVAQHVELFQELLNGK